jgi:hypothetical protein
MRGPCPSMGCCAVKQKLSNTSSGLNHGMSWQRRHNTPLSTRTFFHCLRKQISHAIYDVSKATAIFLTIIRNLFDKQDKTGT